MKRWPLYILLLLYVPVHAQVYTDDTSAVVMRLMGPDSTAFKRSLADMAAQQATGSGQLSDCYMRVGTYYRNHAMQVAGQKYFLAAAKVAEDAGDKDRMAWCYSELGSFYKNRSDFATALQYHNRGLAIFNNSGNKHGIASIYNGIGDVYEKKHEYSTALHYYTASISAEKEAGGIDAAMWAFFNIGEVYMLLGSYDSALRYYDTALLVQQQTGQRPASAWTYTNISTALLLQHKYAAAEHNALIALAIADSMYELQACINAHTSLFKIYEATGDYRQALAHHKILAAQQALIHNEEVARDIARQQMQHDFDKEQESGRRAQEEKDKKTKVVALLLGLTILVLAAAAYLLRRSNKLKAQLLAQSDDILRYKETLMKEIHHRIKNNLQIIRTLLDMQLAAVGDKQAQNAIKESIARLGTISMIHHQLYSTNEASEIEFMQFASNLHMQLNGLFAAGRNITFVNNVPHTVLDIDTAVPLGLILNELITNSYKHAFDGNGPNLITVHITNNGNEYVLHYADNGPGVTDTQIRYGGTGMTIIRTLSRQIGGSFEYDMQGRMFIIVFRNTEHMKRTA